MNRRVVVTGMGAISPLGNSVKENFDKNGIEIPYPQIDVHTR